VLDLLCPLAAGGAIAILGDMRVGATVVVEELALRLKEAPGGLTMFEFLPPGTVHPTAWPADRAEGYSHGTAGTVQTFFFLRERLEPGASMPALDAVDAVIALTPATRAMEIYPCVDPLATRSRLLDPALVGAEHVAVAGRVRAALTALAALDARGEATWSDDERVRAGRGRKLRQFFGQPFFIAEPYTRRPGTRVSRQDTVRACAGILDGAWDHVPEAAFGFAGGMDEVLARGPG
jgi:F-type H+-transporting ATPase subunit beta